VHLSPILFGALVGLVLSQVATLVTTVYLHRGLSHRALTPAPGLTGVFRVLTWVMTGIRPRQWVAVHRKHHAHTDVDGDPHSPLLEGFAMVQLANVVLYRRVAKDEAQVARYARDLPADRWDRALFYHALLGLGLGIAFMVVLWGPVVAGVAAVVHMVSYLLLNPAVNAIGHTWGKQPHPNRARNSQLLAFVTSGEGLHNNHHHASTSPRLSLAPGEIDFGWWFISVARRFGWLKLRELRADAVEQPIAA
jgi:stearoyl-CoA desaturase (delta-9 desaturase)